MIFSHSRKEHISECLSLYVVTLKTGNRYSKFYVFESEIFIGRSKYGSEHDFQIKRIVIG